MWQGWMTGASRKMGFMQWPLTSLRTFGPDFHTPACAGHLNPKWRVGGNGLGSRATMTQPLRLEDVPPCLWIM